MAGARPKFWKPGTAAPGAGLDEERTLGESATPVVFNSRASLSVDQQRRHLPIFALRNHILYLLENYQTVIIVGETGCGKTTQLPQYLIEAGWTAQGRLVAITQPRRVAAVTVATRVAEERGTMLGQEIGYLIRFEDCCDAKNTQVKFLTDGMLVREMMADPLLTKYSVIMLDEAHERTLHTDIAIGLLKKIQKKRPDLRVIVASATLDAEQFHKFFNDNDSGDESKDTAAILTVEGRMFPVEIHYTDDPVPNYLKATVETVMKIVHGQAEGDILAFLTGQEDVQTVVRDLIDEARKLSQNKGPKIRVLPMYSGLPSADQMRVFERTSQHVRKIVVATNIAETSVTIPGIVYIVDCGFVKIKAYNPATGIEALVTVPVSQASATQRAGRAGRIRSGRAYRLFTEEEFKKLPAATPPEMQRTDMAAVVLQLKAMGISSILRFPFLSPPPAQNLIRGLDLLYALKAINDTCSLVDPLGVQMAEFPLSPMYAKMLLASDQLDCSEEVVVIAAMMQINNVFVSPPKEKIAVEKARRHFAVEEGDHLTMYNVYAAFIREKRNAKWCHQNFLNYKGLCRAEEIHAQLRRLMVRAKVKMVSCDGNIDAIRKCITMGFFANAAKLHYSGVYHTVRDGHTLQIHPTSVLYSAEKPPKWVVFNEVVQTSNDFMRDITVIEPEWLYELAPHFYEYGTENERATKRARYDH